jgi:hypothetical protein
LPQLPACYAPDQIALLTSRTADEPIAKPYRLREKTSQQTATSKSNFKSTNQLFLN